MNQKLHIFDLDGVITNTAIVHQKAWARLAIEICRKHHVKSSLKFDQDYYMRRLDGKSRAFGLQEILSDLTIEVGECVFQDYMALKEVLFFFELQKLNQSEIIFPDAVEFLNHLKSAPDNLLTLATSSLNGRKIVSLIGLAKYFDYIADGETLHKYNLDGKPSPDIFNHVIERFKEFNCICSLIYEDSTAGISAALKCSSAEVFYVRRWKPNGNRSALHHSDISNLKTISSFKELIGK